MSNTMDGGSFKEIWTRLMQVKHENIAVFRAIANFELADELQEGDTVNKPYRSDLYAVDYTRGTAITMQDVTNASEALTVNVAKIVPFYVDNLDLLQSSYKLTDEYSTDAIIDLNNVIDGDVLGEYDNATSDLDDADFAGVAGDGITLTTGNILKLFSKAKKKLKRLNIFTDLFAAISPDVEEVLLEYLAGKESMLGDSTNKNGHIGKFYGFDLYVSNSVTQSARLEFGDIPTEGDTVVINGVTFTFNATPSGAGSVDIGTAVISLDNLVAAINDAGTAGTTYIQLTQASRVLMTGIVATDGGTYMTLKGEGKGYFAVSETLSAGADIWTAALQIQHNLFGKKKASDILIQKAPNIDIRKVSNKLGSNILIWTLYGIKTYSDGAPELVDVNVRTSAWV